MYIYKVLSAICSHSNQEHRDEPLLFAIVHWVLLCALHNQLGIRLYVPSEEGANNGFKDVLHKDKCHDQNSKPHSGDRKHQSSSPVFFFLLPRHDTYHNRGQNQVVHWLILCAAHTNLRISHIVCRLFHHQFKLGRYRFILFMIYRRQNMAIFNIIAIN